MAVHSLHIFDRKGKTLFTKRYFASTQPQSDDTEYLAEQRKLIFGMLFSLRDMTRLLVAENATGALQSMETAASTLHTYETPTGLRFCLYTTPGSQHNRTVQMALQHIYQKVWIPCVTRSPLYRPTDPNIEETNFGQQVDEFLKVQPWFA